MFQPVDKVEQARARLANAQQNGSLDAYITMMRGLFLAIPDITQGEKMDRFKRGLKPHLFERVQVHTPPPTTVEEMIAIAALHDAVHHSVKPMGDHKPSNHNNGPAPMELGAVCHSTKKASKPAGGPQEHSRPPGYNRRRCYKCRQKGHSSKDCPS